MTDKKHPPHDGQQRKRHTPVRCGRVFASSRGQARLHVRLDSGASGSVDDGGS